MVKTTPYLGYTSQCCAVRTPGRNAPLIRFLMSALYRPILFAGYIVCFPTYRFFLHFFLTYLLLYLSFPLRIDRLRFQTVCRKRRLNLASVFVFILRCSSLHFL